MKAIAMFLGILSLVILLGASSCSIESTPTAYEQNSQAADSTALTATQAVPVPQITYFAERNTIARWAKAWDKPDIPTYVYLISFGKVIGYYVCNGKPASTQSFLIPDTTFKKGVDVGESYGDVLVEAPDIDGTYGANNPGIRFFTASGIAVEWAGDGASYVYSNAILPLEVPLLGK